MHFSLKNVIFILALRFFCNRQISFSIKKLLIISMKFIFTHLFLIFLFLKNTSAQEIPKIILPIASEWSFLKEGQQAAFQIVVENKGTNRYNLKIKDGFIDGMALDSSGNFSWVPSFSMVERLENSKIHTVIFEASADSTEAIIAKVDFKILHVNQKPIIAELKPFYVQYNTGNVYKIDPDFMTDPDNDPIVILPFIETFPEGMKMNSQGEITWTPSIAQFNKLKAGNSLFIEFMAEDQPAKLQTKGRLKIEATQLDLPPSIVTIPHENIITLKENQRLNLRFYISDPNGDEDIQLFDFITDNELISKKTLIKNTSNQYEFSWQPAYDFVKDPMDSSIVAIDFFALDKTQRRAIKSIKIIVKNAINEAENDLKYYNLYKSSLQKGWELMEQMREKETELKKAYNRAKKGKKSRSILNASLGASTSLSSVFVQEVAKQRLISTIGGTTVLTIGTLEATEVIGRSMKDIMDRLNYIVEKKNEIQTKGDIFSRDFSLKSSRRSTDFIRKVDDFMGVMNLKGLIVLDLDAAWEPKLKSTNENIKKIFKDFVSE